MQKKSKAVLQRDKVTGNYHSPDGKYFIEKCLKGYDVFQVQADGELIYLYSADTLEEIRRGGIWDE